MTIGLLGSGRTHDSSALTKITISSSIWSTTSSTVATASSRLPDHEHRRPSLDSGARAEERRADPHHRAPSSIATSKSPLIPIDSSRQRGARACARRAIAQLAQPREPGARLLGPLPPAPRSSSARRAPGPAAPATPLEQPLERFRRDAELGGLAAHVHLDQHRHPSPRRRRRGATAPRPAPPSPRRGCDRTAPPPAPPCCAAGGRSVPAAPTRGRPRRSAASASWTRFSPRSASPAATASRMTSGRHRLDHPDQDHRAGIASGARGGPAMRSRTSSRRPRMAGEAGFTERARVVAGPGRCKRNRAGRAPSGRKRVVAGGVSTTRSAAPARSRLDQLARRRWAAVDSRAHEVSTSIRTRAAPRAPSLERAAREEPAALPEVDAPSRSPPPPSSETRYQTPADRRHRCTTSSSSVRSTPSARHAAG